MTDKQFKNKLYGCYVCGMDREETLEHLDIPGDVIDEFFDQYCADPEALQKRREALGNRDVLNINLTLLKKKYIAASVEQKDEVMLGIERIIDKLQEGEEK